MRLSIEERHIHRVFILGIFIKGLTGILEILGGFLFLFYGTYSRILVHLTRNELQEDSTGFLARHINYLIPALSHHAQLFGAIYLLIHGVVKIFLFLSLMRKKLWAYPLTNIILILFIVYQTGEFFVTNSPLMLVLTLFDAILVLLTFNEHEYVLRELKKLEKA
jgi:uncharacterized membrane protein